MGIIFEWDRKKATENLKKHGVSFMEASVVFKSNLAMTIHDSPHSDEKEDRYITMGFSGRKMLVVVHCDRGDAIRIISAREATPWERKQYEKKKK